MILKLIASPCPTGSTVMLPPRGMVPAARISMLRSSFTRFFGNRTRGSFQVSFVFSSSIMPRATLSASPVSIEAPAEPAAPNAIRQNCSRAEAVVALFLMSSSAKCGLLVGVVLHHLDAVDDRADRADQVVADPRAQQRREIERLEGTTGVPP